MRPGEIDFSSRAKHYFDISNGEVLAGFSERSEYIASGANPEHVRFIGSLLRNIDDCLPFHNYDTVDSSGWEPEKFQAYGKWVQAMVDDPDNDRQRKLTRQVFNNADKLGIGPGDTGLRRNYGTLSNFYLGINANSVHLRGTFDDWDINRFVSYVRKIGGDRRPTKEEVDKASKEHSRNPSAAVIHRRYKEIGGFTKVIELAGYPIPRHWERDDYIDWGVNFMRANDGLIPTSTIIECLSQKKLGPSLKTLKNKFYGFMAYQNEIERQYLDAKEDQKAEEAILIDDILHRLQKRSLPAELFIDIELADATDESPNTLGPEQVISNVTTRSLLELYAKYIVVESVLNNASPEKIIRLCRDTKTPKDFVKAVKKHDHVDPAELEYAATILGVFNIIWPATHLEKLKLDEDFYALVAEKKQAYVEWQRQYRRSRRVKTT